MIRPCDEWRILPEGKRKEAGGWPMANTKHRSLVMSEWFITPQFKYTTKIMFWQIFLIIFRPFLAAMKGEPK
jgi:hypothetical protein